MLKNAVLKMLAWKHFEFVFKPLPVQIPIKNINDNLDKPKQELSYEKVYVN